MSQEAVHDNPASLEAVERYRYKIVGKPVKHREDTKLVTGKATYVDDVELPVKVFHVAFLRSPYAHARIKSIDYSKALNVEGVACVFTGRDFRDVMLGYWQDTPTLRKPARFPMAISKVTYHGEPVAAVVASDPYIAEDALEEITVDFEPLTVISDPTRAIESGSPVLHEELNDNILETLEYSTDENVSAIIDACPVVISETFKNGRTSPVPLEPRTHLAYYDGERLTIWASTQVPHLVRTFTSVTLGFPETKIRVIAPNVGGGFGPKCNIFADEIAVYAMALRLKIPLKWVETRTEHLLLAGHERDQIHEVRAGFTKQGKIIAVEDNVIADVGVGGVFWTELMQNTRAVTVLPGPYKFNHYAYHVKSVATNKAPWSSNVGFGKPVGTFVMERIMNIAAQKVGLDPAEIRKLNLIRKDDFPYRNPAGVIYDSGNYENSFALLLETMNYEKLKQERDELRKAGMYLGIGFSGYTEPSGTSMIWWQRSGFEIGGPEKVIVRVDPTGRVVLTTGGSDQGQGHKTALSQIAAEELGVRSEEVEVVEGDTDLTAYSIGAINSRTIPMVGNATIVACRKLKDKIRRIGAYSLKTKVENVFIDNGVVTDRTRPDNGITLAEIARIAYRLTTRLPPGEEPYLEETGIYDSGTRDHRGGVSFGWHAAVVKIDPQIGSVEVRKYYIVHDAGVIVNPTSALGQIVGGTICQGFFQGMRELKYDDNGILLTTSFYDYPPPTALDAPWEFKVSHMESHGPMPGGFKGLAEGSAQGAPAALANAICNAMATDGRGISKLPISLNELWNQFKLYVK